MNTMNMQEISINSLIESIQDKKPVSGFTHMFYRYPARFSPKFAGSAIELFTKPNDIVYDPFMGGGTTLIEAMRLHRRSIGTDLNSLSFFITKTKTAIYTDEDISQIRIWVRQAQTDLLLNKHPNRPDDWISQGYQRNINGRTTWPIRKTIEIALGNLDSLSDEKQRNFIRCLLLNTGQWAVDCRMILPSVGDFRKELIKHAEEMIEGSLALRKEIQLKNGGYKKGIDLTPKCLQLSAQEISQASNYPFSSSPRLILTSPPYPGVHVLYHRWQVNGRKETPAPYWIANCLDGNGASFYTFGDRKQKGLDDYFEKMRECYKALYEISDQKTWLVQLVAFSAPDWQLPLFLEILRDCGFNEARFEKIPYSISGRSWRSVPNRKFYADRNGSTPSSQEVLLIHRAI
jgi:DNA modification methylase